MAAGSINEISGGEKRCVAWHESSNNKTASARGESIKETLKRQNGKRNRMKSVCGEKRQVAAAKKISRSSVWRRNLAAAA